MCDRDGQGRAHRLPFVSHGCMGSKLLPKVQVNVTSRSSISSHVIMFLLISYAVEGRSIVSHTRTRGVPLGKVCVFLFVCI